MTEDFRRNVHIETGIEEYRNFFNDDWGERIVALTERAPKLSEIAFDILMEWRAAAYTVSLPVTIIEHMKAYHDTFVTTGEINTTLLRLVDLVSARLAVRIPSLTGDPALIRQIQHEVVNIGAELEDARSRAALLFPLDDTWRSYLDNPVYQLSLWGSQRIGYVSIYNSYDNYLARVVAVALGLDTCRTSDRDFKSQLEQAFGSALLEKCWTSNDINIARLARHALSHAGGRETAQLGKQKHGFVLRDGRIQVTPEKTKALFALLQDSVYALAEAAVVRSEFK